MCSNRTKVETVSDMLELNHSLGIGLTETWLSEDIENAEIQIEDYSIYRADRSHRSRGGVAAYLRSDLLCKTAFSYSNSVCEALLIKCKKLDIVFGVLYRPPSTTVEEWNQCSKAVEEELDLIQAHGDYRTVVLMGDFNFPNLKWNDRLLRIEQDMTRQQETFARLVNKYCLLNVVDIPTRGSNVLDLILTNAEDLFGNTRVEESGTLSDHKWVISDIDISLTRTDDASSETPIYLTKIPNYNWKKGSVEQWDNYQEILNSVDWIAETRDMDVEEKIEFLNGKMEEAVSRTFQDLLERKKIKRKRIPKEVRAKYRRKAKLSKEIYLTKSKTKLNRLIEEVDKIELEIRDSKEAHRKKEEMKVIDQIKVCPKAFYTYARKKAVIRSKIGPLMIDGVLVSDERKMADALSKQYESVCSIPRADISSQTFMEELLRKEGDYETKERLETLSFEEDETRKVLAKLSNGAAVGPDGIPTLCYKYGGDMVVVALTDIARQSLEQNQIPRILKLGWVTPIWKGSDLSLPKDYRPISLTCHLGKVLERLVRQKITDFLSRNNLMENTQHGSRSGRGTLSQLLSQYDSVLSKLAAGKNVDIVYLDFSKAFDMVDHSILAEKMRRKGITGRLLSWICNFLSERAQQVRIGSILSREAPLRSGVPQGSVLGPLLFLIFIADLEKDLRSRIVEVLKYVDDSKLLCNLDSPEDVEESQRSLEAVYRWAAQNNMQWNDGKFQVLRLGKNEDLKDETYLFSPDYKEVIERKEAVKDLGVMVDQNLDFGVQRRKALSKAWRKLGWISRTFSTRSIPFLKTIWTSLVQPHMDYGSIMTAPVSQKGEKLAAEGPLRSLTRMAWEAKGLNYWERLTKFRLYSNERRMERYKALYIWKSLNGLVPSLGLEWTKTEGRSGHRLRYPKIIGPEGHYRTLQRNSIKWEGVRVFNSLPDEFKTFKGSKDSAKNLLDKFLQFIPDQPEHPGMVPGGRTAYGKPSNSISDWTRVLNVDLISAMCYDNVTESNGCEDITNPKFDCYSIGEMAQPSSLHGM